MTASPQPEFGEIPEDWEPVSPFPQAPGDRSFISAEPHSQLLRLKYFRRKTDGALMAKVWFGPRSEGPPGHAHGGSMAAVLDETMGAGAWIAGHQVVAARITIDFKKLFPIPNVAVAECWVDRVDGKKIFTRGVLSNTKGEAFCTGEGLFIVIDVKRFNP